MPRTILVTGALGQISSVLVPALRKRHGRDSVIATDIGNVVVQRKTFQGVRHEVHDLTFAFGFHAFVENGTPHK